MCNYAEHNRDFIQLVLIFKWVSISYILIRFEMIIIKSNKFLIIDKRGIGKVGGIIIDNFEFCQVSFLTQFINKIGIEKFCTIYRSTDNPYLFYIFLL